MFTLQGRSDLFKVTLPDEFLVKEVKEKYAPILIKNKHFIVRPIDFLNETIQKVQVFGFSNASFEQDQQTYGAPLRVMSRVQENAFPMGGAKFIYRNAISPLALTDNTLNIEFRHTQNFLNYMMMYENFVYLYTRDTQSNKLFDSIKLIIFDEKGQTYARLIFKDPVINGMDMLDLDYTKPVAQSGTFKVEFKYSNFDYEFITEEDALSTADLTFGKN